MVRGIIGSPFNLTSIKKLKGLRVTPEEQMPYIAGALAGTAISKLVACTQTGFKPCGS